MHWRQLKCQPPVYTLESSSTPGPSDNISSSSDDENQGTTPKKKAPSSKRPSKKRKSGSSVAEMLGFLKDYQQQREEVENKKMNEDKKTFWASLLEVMKTAKN